MPRQLSKQQRFRSSCGRPGLAIYLLDTKSGDELEYWRRQDQGNRERNRGEHFALRSPTTRPAEPQRRWPAVREGKDKRRPGAFARTGPVLASVLIDQIHDDRGELVGFAKDTRHSEGEGHLALEEARAALAQSQSCRRLVPPAASPMIHNLMTVIADLRIF